MKNIRFRKWLALLICGMTLATSGCGGGDKTPSNIVKGLPDYSADEAGRVVMMGGFCAPHKGVFDDGKADYITEEAYAEMREAGLDYVMTLYEQGPTNPDILRHLDCAASAGVKVMVRWDAITGFANATPQSMENALNGIQNHEAFYGIMAKDEPSASLFSDLGKACAVYKQAVPDKYFFVNLIPKYANNSQLGTNTYNEYVNRYCALVDNGMIMHDHYPYGHIEGTEKYTVGDGMLLNLETILKYAQYYHKEHWAYVQAERKFIGMTGKVIDYYDMRHQIYTNMCYGVTNMQYFCYFSPADKTEEKDAAFIGSDGKKTQRWYDGQKINAEVHKFDHVYLNYAENHTGTMTILGSKNTTGKNKAYELLKENIALHERIASVSAEQDTIIGTYKDGDGRDGFMIVNYSVPAYRTKDKVSIAFKYADAVIYYREGEHNLVELQDGKFEIELDAGEGIFAIPVKY